MDGDQSRWGDADTYFHARKMPGKGKYNDKVDEMNRVEHSREIIGLITEV